MPKKNESSPSFEQALAELETMVDTLEKGELSLEESLHSFERGVKLTRICQQALKEAEQKVQILSSESLDAELDDFQNEQ
ncbi:MAG: exodeoxyribonuclease VII small subunit [Gammaproteobacteria bacterium]|nr:exodeoxyribonuclease VII small subunit [Gammaproteobacteria bacterium]